MTRLACGGFAGTLGQTVAYPLDVVRRRLQVPASRRGPGSSRNQQKGNNLFMFMF